MTEIAEEGEIILRRVTNNSIEYTFGEIPGTDTYFIQLVYEGGQTLQTRDADDIIGLFENLNPGDLYILNMLDGDSTVAATQVRTSKCIHYYTNG